MSKEDNEVEEIADALVNMSIGEAIAVGPDVEIMCVPMGWIFYRTYKASVTGTFVPYIPAPGKRKNPVIDLSQAGMH